MGGPELVASDVLEIHRVPCLADNYAWLLHEPKAGLTAIVDPSEVQPVVNVLKEKWALFSSVFLSLLRYVLFVIDEHSTPAQNRYVWSCPNDISAGIAIFQQ